MKRINKTYVTKIMAVAAIAFLLIGTQFLSTVLSQNITSKRIDYSFRQETVNITCCVFTESGVESITKTITKSEKAYLDQQLNKTRNAVKIIHDEEAGFLEKKKAYAIVRETSIQLKQLGLLLERISIEEATSLISGEYGKHVFDNRINIYENLFSSINLNKLFYPNAFCSVEGTANLVIWEFALAQLPIVIMSSFLSYLLVDCGWENTFIGKLFLLPICLFLEGIYNITHNMPKLVLPMVAFVGLPLGSNYCTLETRGLLGHWKISPGFVGLAYGFIGIWLPKHVFGYTAGIIAKP